jgi:antitoxin component of MazEF toxin-antitoxin module
MRCGFMLAGNAQRAHVHTAQQRERKRAASLVLSWTTGKSTCVCPLLLGGNVSDTPLLLDQKPLRYWGGSYVVTLNKSVREALGVKVGDHVAFRKFGRFVFLFVIRPQVVAPITEKEIREARASLGG